MPIFLTPSLVRVLCRTCNRNLPRAASRCPWCKTPRPRGGWAEGASR